MSAAEPCGDGYFTAPTVDSEAQRAENRSLQMDFSGACSSAATSLIFA
ncbi:MAG: hypothetical protein ACKPJD_02475 [Planctomycetaceae bacterium]